MVAAVVLVCILVVGAVLARRRRPGQPPGASEEGTSEEGTPDEGTPDEGTPVEAPGPTPIEELRRAADTALVEADNAIMASAGELEIARSQVGDSQALVRFDSVLQESRQDRDRALQLRERGPTQDGDDGERSWLEQIITLSSTAQARLDECVESFDELRDLPHRVDEVLASLSRSVAAVGDDLRRAHEAFMTLSARYPETAVAVVRANLSQADERLRLAAGWAQTGIGDLALTNRQGAVARARAAEEALGQATALIEGLRHAPDALQAAQQAVAALLLTTQDAVAEAQAMDPGQVQSTTQQFAQDTIDWARERSASGSYDPLATRRALEDTSLALEVGLGPRRAALAARQRALALLGYATGGSYDSIRATQCFITTRRGAVGAEARTRLARAARLFEDGVDRTESDPEAALAELQEADALADQALALAQQDEANFLNAQRMGRSDATVTTVVAGGIVLARASRSSQGWWAVASFGGRSARDRWHLSEPL